MIGDARTRRTVVGVAVAVGSLLVAMTSTGCETTSGTARPAPPPTVAGPETPLPPTPPWTLPQLVGHQCVVLGPDELARFGFRSPDEPGRYNSYCRWQTPSDAPVQIASYFAPDPWHKYTALRDEHSAEERFRTLTIAQRPAFLIDEHRDGGYRNCRIWVSVPSGGAIQFEYALRDGDPAADVCAAAVDVVTAITVKVR
ncbi:DUF3558 family protein [Nocardia sp. BMG51109]|uniref:DUF3558 family protein n=1 Tax=Nocardia sp. BMG51109 TaxID=1056816 RepID=UPI0004664138|nr:DUF3558 family protein [Nocardia sp. BMG51109]